MNKYILYLFLSSITLPFFSQEYENILPPEHIKTIQLFNPTTNNQSPFIADNEHFILSFDDLNSSYKRYYYYVKHYDRYWEETGLFDSEIVDGYFTDEISNYQSSYNTYQSYLHYQLRFPNQRMSPKISGNFALFVYTQSKSKPLFSVRFSIFENTVNIGVKNDIFNAGSTTKANQKIEVFASANGNINFTQNVQDLSLTLLKNNNWNESLSQIKPLFIHANSAEFKQNELQFFGGNNYYWFDTKNKEIRGLTTQHIIKEKNEVVLYANLITPEIYDYNPDVNGAFYVRRNDLGRERNANIEADYTNINIALQTEKLVGKEVYVMGAFSRYLLNENYKMKYNDEGFYEITIPLKQGYYNYQFIAKDTNGNLDFTLNGNFWEAENLYTALLYYKGFGGNYDRLIGLGENK